MRIGRTLILRSLLSLLIARSVTTVTNRSSMSLVTLSGYVANPKKSLAVITCHLMAQQYSSMTNCRGHCLSVTFVRMQKYYGTFCILFRCPKKHHLRKGIEMEKYEIIKQATSVGEPRIHLHGYARWNDI